jgi:hypothetical protein
MLVSTPHVLLVIMGEPMFMSGDKGIIKFKSRPVPPVKIYNEKKI